MSPRFGASEPAPLPRSSRPARRQGAAWAPLLVFAAIVLNIGIARGSSSLDTFFNLRKSKSVLSESVERLRRENDELANEIQRLKKSPNYARKVLRDKYHVTDEDESIVFFGD
jgi:cell division protein FtsB